MSSLQKPKRTFHLFYSYAEEDKLLLNSLEKHLGSLKQLSEIQGWDRRSVSAGNDWKQEVSEYIDKCSIILLLISQHYIDSAYYYGYEMEYAIQRSRGKKAIIIPIILRPCDWDLEGLPFREYEVLPSNEKPVTEWSNQDQAFHNIARGIRKVVDNLREYEEELKANQLDPAQYRPIKSIKSTQNNAEKPKTEKITPPTSKTTTTIRSTRKEIPDAKRNAQTATVESMKVRKNLPGRTTIMTTVRSFFSANELKFYTRKNNEVFGILLMIFFLIDVFGLAFVTGNWSQSQQLPPLIFSISLILYLLGILNINLLIAMLLTTLYCVTWFFVGLYYIHWNQFGILILTIGASIIRFLFFQSHQRGRR